MSDPRTDYDKAIVAYEATQSALMNAQRIIEDAARKLNSTTAFILLPDKEGTIQQVTSNEANMIDGINWPTASDLKKMLDERRSAGDAIKHAWQQIPQQQRVNINQHPYAR